MSWPSDDSEGDFELVESHEARLPQKELDKITKWLQPTLYNAESNEFNRHLLSRSPGTGSWLRETDAYNRWRDSPHHGGLWIKGVPGAGKSVLAASIVDHLKTTEDPDTPILFFFFRHIVLANRNSVSLMRDWLAQLLPHSVAVQGVLQPMAKTSKMESVSEGVLWDCVLKGLQDVPRVFCVADALDEMETKGSATFFQRLNGLATFSSAKVKLLMTSRPRQDLQSCLSATSTIHISLEEEKVGREIETFIKNRLQHTSVPNTDQEALSKAIAARSRGLFLYAKLLIDQVLPALKDDANIDIKALPIHLEDMYNQMLARQAKEISISTELQVSLLGLITHSTRPLRLRELAGFLEHEHHIESLDKAKSIARFACHPLVQILEDETVQVIHHSFTEYLLDVSRQASVGGNTTQFPVLNPAKIHRDLAVACLKTVTPILGLRRNESEDPTILMPFLNYARSNIMSHASKDKDIVDEELFDLVSPLCAAIELERGSGFVNFWISSYDLDGVVNISTPLHFAAACGLEEFCRRILSSDPPLQSVWPQPTSSSDSHDPPNSAFLHACINGHLNIVQMIWAAEPKHFKDNTIKSSVMKKILARGFSEILEFLIQIGLRPAPRHTSSWGEVEEIKLYQNTTPECLALLLPYFEEKDMEELFCDYASGGHADMMKIMVEKVGAKATWRMNGGTAMYRVCCAENKTPQHVKSMEMLLSSFPDVDYRETIVKYSEMGEATRQPEKDRTVLHALAANWYDGNHEISLEMFELLIKAGADLEARDGMGDTPVLCLFPSSFNKSVQKPLKYLLDAGANAHVRDNKGSALIHRSVHRHVDVTLMKILVEHGVDVNTLAEPRFSNAPQPVLAMFWDDTNWGNFLYGFPEKGHDFVESNTRGELAAYLIQQGAKIDAGGDPVAVLGEALQSCDLDSFKLLLTAKSEENSIDGVMFSLKHHLRSSRQEAEKLRKPNREPIEFILALVSAGVSVEVRDANGATPLLRTINDKVMFNAFVQAGADKTATDKQGRGILFQLAGSDHSWGKYSPSSLSRLESFRQLLEMGFDPLPVDKDGVSLLHAAVTFGGQASEKDEACFIENLLECGISPRWRTNNNMTPLHSFFDLGQQSHIRASPKDLEVIIGLFEKAQGGFDINAKDDEGMTPLHMAAVLCNAKSLGHVHVLVEHSADLQVVTEGGRNALHLAARARNSGVVGYLTARCPESIHQMDASGRTPLFDACASGIAESVACLVRAGADVSVKDVDGWTPLHACAEFTEEQREWTKNEEALNSKQETKLDRYRPYIPTSIGEAFKFTPYLRSYERRDDDSGESYLIENTYFAILSATKVLLDAGADAAAQGGTRGLTPAQRAFELGCEGMSAALKRYNSQSLQESVEEDATSKLIHLEGAEKKAILEDPWQSMSGFSSVDITWLKENNASFHCGIGVKEEENDLFERAFYQKYNFLETLVLAGEAEVMAQLEDLVRRDEDPETAPIDKWTIDVLESNAKCTILSNEQRREDTCGNHPWKPEEIKTVADFLRPIDWDLRPVLHVACQRVAPNMEMLRALVERCSVNVKMPSMRFHEYPEGRETDEIHCLLPFLATEQQFWHLDAIRYLVSKGADINSQDQHWKTALHRACASEKVFSGRFVKLLLELGADPHLEDAEDCSSIQVVASPEKLQIFAKHGIDITDRLNASLWLGVGKLSLDLVRMALDSGCVDVNRKEALPIYTRDELDWEIHSTPLRERCAAIPLAGALLYSDYIQVNESPTGEDIRANLIRLLLDRGADPFGPYFISKKGVDDAEEYDETPLMHYVFENIQARRAHLEVLLEYTDTMDLNRRDSRGRTVFLAACASKLCWVDFPAFHMEESPESDDVVDYKSEAIWDSTGLFLKMMNHGVDVAAVDKDGNNALVSPFEMSSLFLTSLRILFC